MLKKILAGLTTAVLALGVVALVAGPASAHHNTVTAAVVCSPTGYTVTWTVVNSEAGKTEQIVESSNPSLVAVGTTFQKAETKTFVQTVTAPQDLTLTLKGFWADGSVYSVNSGSIGSGAFPVGCLEAIPTVSKVQSQCDGHANSYTVPTYTIGGTGVVWYINNSPTPTPAGTYNAVVGAPIHAEAKPLDSRYKLVGTAVYDYTFQAPTEACTEKVVPVKPQVTQQICTGLGDHSPATYTIPAITGVLWAVKLDGGTEKTVLPGTFSIADGVKTIQIIARGDTANNYVVEGGSVVFDYDALNPAGKCLTEVLPVKPSSVQAVCDTKANPGSVPDSTYTLTYVPHVIYQVSVDGAPAVDVVLTQTTTYTVEKPASVIVVTARADDPTKYQTAAFSETLTFTDPGGCLSDLAYINPSVTQQFCDDGLTGDAAPTGDLTSDATTITAAAAAVGDPVTVPGTVTIPVTPNVEYFIDGSPAPAGVYTLTPGTHVVSIEYDALKYQLAPGIVVPFIIDIDGAPCLPTEPLVTPAAASSGLSCFSNGSVTLSNDLRDAAAVLWTVNGTSSKQGTFPVTKSGTVTVTAAANAPAYGFGEGTQTSWTFTFSRPAGCDLQTLALTGQSPMGLLLVADFLVVAGLALIGVRVLRRNRDRLTVD